MSELRLMHKHAYLSICKITDNNAKTNAVITQTATEPQGIILYPDSGKEHFLLTLKTYADAATAIDAIIKFNIPSIAPNAHLHKHIVKHGQHKTSKKKTIKILPTTG